MKHLILIIVIINFNICISIGQKQSTLNQNILNIEIIDTYTCMDLAQKMVDIDKVLSKMNDSNQNNWQKYHPLFSVFQMNLNNQNIPRLSVYQGFCEIHDTSLVIKYFKQSLLMPVDIFHEWRNQTDKIFALIIHKKNEKKITLDVSDIKIITFDKNRHSKIDDDDCYRQNFKDSENTMLIILKKNALVKIRDLKESQDVLIKIIMKDRTFILSLPYKKIKNGIYIKDNISNTFAEELRFTYPSIIKHF